MKGPCEGPPLSLGRGGKWTVYMKPTGGGWGRGNPAYFRSETEPLNSQSSLLPHRPHKPVGPEQAAFPSPGEQERCYCSHPNGKHCQSSQFHTLFTYSSLHLGLILLTRRILSVFSRGKTAAQIHHNNLPLLFM